MNPRAPVLALGLLLGLLSAGCAAPAPGDAPDPAPAATATATPTAVHPETSDEMLPPPGSEPAEPDPALLRALALPPGVLTDTYRTDLSPPETRDWYAHQPGNWTREAGGVLETPAGTTATYTLHRKWDEGTLVVLRRTPDATAILQVEGPWTVMRDHAATLPNIPSE